MAAPRTAAKRVSTKPEVAAIVDTVEELVEEVVELLVEEEVEAQKEADTILIHFVRDGVTAFGTVWYAGQEVEIARDSDAFKQTIDRSGDSWLDKSEEERLNRGPLTWKSGPSDIKNELIDYPENFDPHGMTYHKGEWFDLTMLKIRAEKEIARGRSIPKN